MSDNNKKTVNSTYRHFPLTGHIFSTSPLIEKGMRRLALEAERDESKQASVDEENHRLAKDVDTANKLSGNEQGIDAPGGGVGNEENRDLVQHPESLTEGTNTKENLDVSASSVQKKKRKRKPKKKKNQGSQTKGISSNDSSTANKGNTRAEHSLQDIAEAVDEPADESNKVNAEPKTTARNKPRSGTESEVSDLTCPTCGHTSITKSHLNSHIREVHLGIKPYVCDVCGHRSSRSTNLRMHKLRVHAADLGKLLYDAAVAVMDESDSDDSEDEDVQKETEEEIEAVCKEVLDNIIETALAFAGKE